MLLRGGDSLEVEIDVDVFFEFVVVEEPPLCLEDEGIELRYTPKVTEKAITEITTIATSLLLVAKPTITPLAKF